MQFSDQPKLTQKLACTAVYDTVYKLCQNDGTRDTLVKKFQELDISNTLENRIKFRELIITTPGLEQYISGVVLCQEGLQSQLKNMQRLSQHLESKGIVPGIRMDIGSISSSLNQNEVISLGFDSLQKNVISYTNQGIKFAKWKQTYISGEGLPSQTTMLESSMMMSRFAVICQDACLVPLLCPEMIFEGTETYQQIEKSTKRVLSCLINCLNECNAHLDALILMLSIVSPGMKSLYYQQISPEELGIATIDLLMSTISASIPGIFLNSYIFPEERSVECLTETLKAYNKYNQYGIPKPLPWRICFGGGWSVTYGILREWAGKQSNVSNAQNKLLDICKAFQLAILNNQPFFS